MPYSAADVAGVVGHDSHFIFGWSNWRFMPIRRVYLVVGARGLDVRILKRDTVLSFFIYLYSACTETNNHHFLLDVLWCCL